MTVDGTQRCAAMEERRWKRRVRGGLIAFSMVLMGEWACAGNFVCQQPELVPIAEQARTRSALFWSGSTLPGEWSRPCPISVVPTLPAGGGRTQFQFVQGEVFGWRMSVSGTAAELQSNIIPHEVDHMVRASLVRHGIERWLDEGCASLMESPEAHARLRVRAARLPAELLTEEWLTAGNYPGSAAEMEQLYAAGFSLVEYLLTLGTPGELLEFQRDTDALPARLQRRYRLSVPALRTGWSQWKAGRTTACSACGCPLHGLQEGKPAVTGRRPKLTIWSAGWCAACQQFKQDFTLDAAFRSSIEGAFDVHWMDYDQQSNASLARSIQELPTFDFPGGRVTGYLGKDHLLRRLQLHSSTEPPPAPADVSEARPPPVPGNAAAPISGSTAIHSSPGRALLRLAPITLTALQWAGVIGGSVATGGVGGIVLAGLGLLIRRRWSRNSNRENPLTPAPGRSAVATQAPFPRQLDEAGQLLGLRQSEGRVGVLDALRGMFVDDELEKLAQSEDPAAVRLVEQLREAIDARVDEVAPLSTQG